MSGILVNDYDKPFLFSKDNIVKEVNEAFVNLVGYAENELIGKSLTEVSRMIRIDLQINLQDIDDESKFYIFSKSLEAIEVSILCYISDNKYDKILYFTEQPHSDFEQIFEFARRLSTDRKTGVAVRRLSDLLLLKADQNFLDMLEDPYNKKENTIGRINEFVFGGTQFSGVYSTIVSTGEPYYCEEIEYIQKDKGVVYYNASLVPIFIQGELKYLVQALLDVTAKVLARKDIEQKNKELEAIFEYMSDILIIFDKNGDCVNMNKAARDNPLLDFIDLKDFKKSFEKVDLFDTDKNQLDFKNLPFNRVLRGEKLSGYRVVKEHNDGVNYFEVNGTPIYDAEGNFTTGVLISSDVTNRIKNEENLLLKAQYDLLSRMIEELELGLIRVSYPELDIIDLNNKAYNEVKQVNPKMSSLSSIIGKNITNVLIVDKEYTEDDNIWNKIEKKEQSIIYTRKFIMDNEERYFKIIMQPLYGLNNEIVEMIVISIEITDEVRATNKMEEILKTQDDLFVNMSHELKTPLNVIYSASQLMDLYIDTNSIETSKNLIINNNNIIKQNCYRLIKLINNIVDYSKIESGYLKLNLRNEDIVGTIENIVQSVSAFTSGKGLKIIFDTNIEEKILAFDTEKIERVILNLISNAVKFSNIGNVICIKIMDKNEFVQISVKDNGIGIEEDHLSSIFERFMQVDNSLSRNSEGSGIGLSLVKSIVELHGGSISVESELGKGSIFKVQLPVTTTEHPKFNHKDRSINMKSEMINIELSDIY